MADIKFNCPRCEQKICLDELCGGQQFPCPGCNETITAPSQRPTVMVASPAPPPAAAEAPARLSINKAAPAHAPAPAPAAPRPVTAPAHAKPDYRQFAKPKETGGGAMKTVKIGAVVIVLCVAGYFGFQYILKLQDDVNEKRRTSEANADGGQVGHIADLYDVLDATDPDKMPRFDPSSRAPRNSRSGKPDADMDEFDPDDRPTKKPAPKALPILPAVWTLDLAGAKIPEGQANGKIAGTNFVVQVARLDMTATAYVLRLTQGTLVAPESEFIVFLRLKPGEKIGGGTWNISKDMKGATVPQIAKRWKPNPKYAPTTKNFPTGYAMKLELGPIRDGELTGKIFLALPDPEQSVVAGIFTAGTSLSDSVESPTPTTKTPTPVPTAGQVRPEDRYGVGGGIP